MLDAGYPMPDQSWIVSISYQVSSIGAKRPSGITPMIRYPIY
jgi:hypothetical protein